MSALVPAAGSSGDVSLLDVLSEVLEEVTLFSHESEVHVRAGRVLVADLSGEPSRGVGAVSLPGFEGVEVPGGAWGRRVPLSVDLLLLLKAPDGIIELSVDGGVLLLWRGGGVVMVAVG